MPEKWADSRKDRGKDNLPDNACLVLSPPSYLETGALRQAMKSFSGRAFTQTQRPLGSMLALKTVLRRVGTSVQSFDRDRACCGRGSCM